MTKAPSRAQESLRETLVEKSGSDRQIAVIAKPGKEKTRIASYSEEGNEFTFELKARPVEGKANAELLKYIRKVTGHNFEIISGSSSRTKILRRL